MSEIDRFKQILNEKGFKATPQRLAVHQAMLQLCHASADQVSAYIKEHNLATVSEASVYNTLNWLSSLGVYAFRMSRNNKLYFDVNNKRHIHLYDRVNHHFMEINDQTVIEQVEKLFKGRRWRGYRFEGIDISLVCRPSSKKR